MTKPRHLFFTVTNDLNYDQRMIRICSSLAAAGFRVTLVGRSFRGSPALGEKIFGQKRLRCRFRKGPLSYAEFNIRLLFYLLGRKMDLICAIDLDTIIPCWLVSVLKRVPRVYDAHELFCEMQEVMSRPAVYRCWKAVERFLVPRFRLGYTVNDLIREEFHRMYGSHYAVIRNLPLLEAPETHKPVEITGQIDAASPSPPSGEGENTEKYILYQGAVNEGRSFETLIPAMAEVNARLVICGDGNFMQQARKLVSACGLDDKVCFTGKLPPAELKEYTRRAYLGVTLFEDRGLSNYYSLANRFFDYMHAGVPQVCVDYPAYRAIVQDFPFAMLITGTETATIVGALNTLLRDEVQHRFLRENCLLAREQLNWQEEEKKLLSFYRKIFGLAG